MKVSLLFSIKPYYVFLIIAKQMGWDIPENKSVELRKSFPRKNLEWDFSIKIYCTKNFKSFRRIPKEFRTLMKPFLGKVIGEFICDKVEKFKVPFGCLFTGSINEIDKILEKACIKIIPIGTYYSYTIGKLTIYKSPKCLSEFKKPCAYTDGTYCIENKCEYYDDWTGVCRNWLERPPQSWCYVYRG